MKKNWREIRKEIGFAQKDMAHALGISNPNYCMKENYKRKMSTKEAALIIEMYREHTGKTLNMFTDIVV